MSLNARRYNHKFGDASSLIGDIIKEYTAAITFNVLKALGSVSVLNAPVSIVGGVADLVYEPTSHLLSDDYKGNRIKGLRDGVTKGVQSALSNTASASFGVIGQGAKALNVGAAMLTFDKEYRNAAKGLRRKDRTEHGLGFNLRAGAKAVGMGFAQGISGVVYQPYIGAKKGGIKGFIKGVAKGVVGVPMKPISGILQGVAKTSQGIKAFADRSSDRRYLAHAKKKLQTFMSGRMRLPRAFPRSIYNAFSPFDIVDAMGVLILKKVANASYAMEDIRYYLMLRDNEEGSAAWWLLLTNKRILVIYVPEVARLKNNNVSFMLPLDFVEDIEIKSTSGSDSKQEKCTLGVASSKFDSPFEGPLKKRGGVVTTWNTRWFRLSKTTIDYYPVMRFEIAHVEVQELHVQDELSNSHGNVHGEGSVRRVSNLNSSRVVVITTSSPHKLTPEVKCLAIVGFSTEDSRRYHHNNGLKAKLQFCQIQSFLSQLKTTKGLYTTLVIDTQMQK